MRTGVTTLHSHLPHSLWQADHREVANHCRESSTKGTLERLRANLIAFFMMKHPSLSVTELYGGLQSSIQQIWMVSALEYGWRQLNESRHLKCALYVHLDRGNQNCDISNLKKDFTKETFLWIPFPFHGQNRKEKMIDFISHSFIIISHILTLYLTLFLIILFVSFIFIAYSFFYFWHLRLWFLLYFSHVLLIITIFLRILTLYLTIGTFFLVIAAVYLTMWLYNHTTATFLRFATIYRNCEFISHCFPFFKFATQLNFSYFSLNFLIVSLDRTTASILLVNIVDL